MEKLCDSCCHVFINCTSVGMYPKVDASPIDGQEVKFTAETVVFDTIYNPMETKFLKAAREAGAKTISGVEMFVRQAVRQFEGWTGEGAPVGVMRKVVQDRLAGS
jgi:shikimate 5-dehydrogenase